MRSESAPDTQKRRDSMLAVLVWAMIFSAFASGLSRDVGPVTIALSHVLLLLLLGYEVLVSSFSRQRVPILFRDDISFLLYLFLFSNLASSLLFSAHRLQSLKGCAPLVAGVLIYTAIRAGIRLMNDSQGSISKLMLFNLLSAGFGLGCMALAMITGTENIGVSFGHLAIGMTSLMAGIPPSIRGLGVEPNLFSISTAVVLCLPLARFMTGERTRREWLVLSVLCFAIVFAYTRSVYGALLLIVLTFMMLSRQTRVIKRVAIFGGIALLMVLVLGIALPEENRVKKAFTERIDTMFDFESGTGGGRLLGYKAAWTSFLERPLLGKGTLSAETSIYNPYTGLYQERMGGEGWLTGSGIQALHDTGILGFVILMGLFGMLIWKNYRLFLRLSPMDDQRSLAMGFLGGNIIILITSQLSSPLWTAFPYIFWAINAEFIRSCTRKSEGHHLSEGS